MSKQLGAALALPVLALALQWALWDWLSPFVWFLFFPAVFLSARIAGLRGGLLSTLLSIGLVWYFFIPPQLSWAVATPTNLYSAGLFLLMGYLFSDAQDRLRHAQATSERALAETRSANEDITRMYQRTLELDELKSQFFANISHELRTPLTLIMSPLVRRLAAPEPPPPDRHEDEVMLRSARILYRHVSDLLDAAKLESGLMPIEYTLLDVGNLLRAMASQFDSLAHDHKIEFRLDIPRSLAAEVDAEKVQRIVLNLLANAFKFTPEGGTVSLSARVWNDGFSFEVSDNGPGIPEPLRSAVFERFRQLDGGTQQRQGGTGLGLAIVKEFAELHGGTVRVTKAEGGGACFTVNLPLRAPEGTPIQTTPSQLDPLGDHHTIGESSPASHQAAPSSAAEVGRDTALVLVVEDSADMNAFIAKALHPHYRVACAHDGQEGLESAQALHPDLIVCDVMMPRMNGELMVTALRNQAAMADIPIVMLTARDDDALRRRLFDIGVQDYLNKPFAVDDLLSRVRGLIDKRRQAQEVLRLSEKRFYDIVNASVDWIWELDTEARFVYASESVRNLLGYAPEELRDISLFELMPAEEGRRMREVFDALSQQRASFRDLDQIVRHKNGELRNIQSAGEPILDRSGALLGYRGIGRDVTEKKRAEERIRVSEERLTLALEATHDGLWDWDLNTDRVYLTPRYYALAGYPGGPGQDDFAFFKNTVHPDDLPDVLAHLQDHLRGATPSCEFDYRLQTAHGETRWIRGRGRVVERDADGRALRTVGTLTDISSRKAEEQTLHQQATELSRRNAELERFNRATVGRELDMIALKQQVNALAQQLGQEPPYPLAFMQIADLLTEARLS